MNALEHRWLQSMFCRVAVVALVTSGTCSADEPPAAGSKVSPPLIRPAPADARELAEIRERMVTRQIQQPLDGRTPVRSEGVCAAMRAVPRHAFVPAHLRGQAYADSPLPIGHDQTISQPYIVALMTELLGLTPESKVLEVGTGSGYQAAVLAHLTPHVYTIEIVEPLAERAARILRELGYDSIQCRRGDGYLGWPEHAPFDAVIVTCAADDIPPPLWAQLKPGGRMVIPVGEADAVQQLVVIRKTEDGERRSRTVIPVRFVPLTREPHDDDSPTGDRDD